MPRKWTWIVVAGTLAAAGSGATALAKPSRPSMPSMPSMQVTPAPTVTQTFDKATFGPLDVTGTYKAERWKAKIKTQSVTDLYFTTTTLPPGTSTDWHSHPGPSLVIVKAGIVTNYMSSDPQCMGQVLALPQHSV